jgi:hypothetical protein
MSSDTAIGYSRCEFTHAAQQLTFTVGVTLRHHRTVKVQENTVDGLLC